MFAPFVLAPLVLARLAETVVVSDIRTCATPIPRIESSSVGTRGDPVRTRIRWHGPVAIHEVAIAVIISVHPGITGARARRPVGGRYRSRLIIARCAELYPNRKTRLREERPARYQHDCHQFLFHCGVASLHLA